MKKGILSFLGVILLSSVSLTQSSTTSSTVDLVERTPSSPNAGSISRYFDFPVNMATGQASISVPIYTIQTGRITVPITLKYNTVGVKAAERANWVGTNWTLETGGSVNKKVNGYDDIYATGAAPSGTSGPQYNYINPDYSQFINNFSNLSDFVDSIQTNWLVQFDNLEDSRKFLGRVALGYVDGEADEYFFSMPSGGGTFFYNQKESAFISNKPDGTSIFCDLNNDSSFYITTKEGLEHKFSIKERVVNPIFKKSMGSSMKYLTNAFHLEKIVDPKTQKAVVFAYDNRYSDEVTGQSMWVDYKFIGSTPYYYGADNTYLEREGDEYTVSSIQFTEGKVLFIKDTANRLDGGTKALKEVQVYNNRNKLLKRVKLNYFYLTSDTSIRCTTPYNRMFLSSVQETEYNESGDSLVKPPYVFSYKNDVKLPCIYSYAFDHWGFYNGKTSNTTTLPTIQPLLQLGIPAHSNKDIDTTYTQCGILKSIQYPTGGTTNFEYEYNRTDTIVGGLRVKKIMHVDSVANKSITKEFEYKNSAGQSSGQVLFNPVLFYNYHSMDQYGGYPVYRIHGDAISPLFPNQGSPVLYTQVLEKITGPDGDIRIRHYMTGFDAYSSTIYRNMCCGVPFNKHPIRSDLVGIEIQTETYKYEGGAYNLTSSNTSNVEPLTNEDIYAWNVQVAWAMVMDGWIVWPGNDPYSTNPINLNPSVNAYKIVQQSLVKKENYTTIVDNGVEFKTGEKLVYDQHNSLVKESTSVDSQGDTTITSVKYTGDFEYIPGSTTGQNFQLKMLWDYFLIAEPVEIVVRVKPKDSVNSKLISATLYEYEGLNISKVYKIHEKIPFSLFSAAYNDSTGFYKDSRYTLQQEVIAWDSLVKPKTVVTNRNLNSYIWDVNFSGPIASVVNASHEDIAFTTFEGFANGGWTGAAATRDSTYTITGRKSYQLSWGNLVKSGLTSSKQYIVSYWSRNGSYSISGSTATLQGRTVNGWTYYEHSVTGVSSITVSGSGTSFIDELRLYPKSAQMGTYTYEELLGVKSLCDANNRISYYEYWGPGQLKLVKDEEGNILKRLEYRYMTTTGE